MTPLYIVGAVAGVIAIFFLWRARNGWPSLPAWTWHDIRKLLALVFTILGAAVVTLMAWWLLDEMVTMAKLLVGEYLNTTRATAPPREVGVVLVKAIDVLAWGLKLLLAGSLIVLLSLGFVITPRSFEFRGPGNTGGSFRGGDEMPAAPPPVEAAERVEQQVNEAAAGAVQAVKAETAQGGAVDDRPPYARE